MNNGGKVTNEHFDEWLKKYEYIVSIWQRWDESYWTSFNYFLVINGLFFVAFYTVFNKLFNDNTDVFVSSIFCIFGFFSCIIWLYILNKKLTFIYLAECVGRKHEEKIYPDLEIKGCFYGNSNYLKEKEKNNYKDVHETIKWYQKGFIKLGSGKLTACAIPILFCILWGVLFVYVLYSFNVNLSILASIIFISIMICFYLTEIHPNYLEYRTLQKRQNQN